MFRNITHSNPLDLVAQLAEHWTSKPKVAGSILTVVRLNFRLPGVDIIREEPPISNIIFAFRSRQKLLAR